MKPRGSIENTALLGMAVTTALTYSALVGASILREQIRIDAIIAEAHMVIEAIRNHQADESAPIAPSNALEVGWPDAGGSDGDVTTLAGNCARAVAALTGDGADAIPWDGIIQGTPRQYLPPQFTTDLITPPPPGAVRSPADPRLRWWSRCPTADGEALILRLSSFGTDPACSIRPGGGVGLAQECPGIDVARLIAHSTGGRVRRETLGDPTNPMDPASPAPFASATNVFVEWIIFRGAAAPALNELYEQVLAKDYTEARTFGIDNPTAAFSGVQLGGWTDSLGVRHFANHPAELARWISGIDSAAPDTQVEPLTVGATRIDARSFAVFNRAVRYNVFDTADDDLFTVASPGPCAGGGTPQWIATVESVQMTFGGFANTNQAVITVGASNTGAVLNPTGWQVYDDGGAGVYSPEVRAGVFAVLPGFEDAITPTPGGLCRAVVIEGEVASGDTDAEVAVFEALDTDTVAPDVQIARPCVAAGIPYTVTQTIRPIPRAQLAALNDTPTSPPTIRLSVMGYCPGRDDR